MSAIVAKVLNDTVGTPEFKGLNQILDELKENIKAIKDAVMPVSNLSHPIYWYSDGDIVFATVEYQKKIKLNYDGIVRVYKSGDGGSIASKNAEAIEYVSGSGTTSVSNLYRISKGAEFWLEGDDGSPFDLLAVAGHVEFAPSLDLEIID